MGNILFIDSKFGIAGDMMLASLIDLGADIEYIKKKLVTLEGIDDFSLEVSDEIDHGMTAKELILEFEGIEKNHHHDKDHGSAHIHSHAEKHEHDHHHEHRTANEIIEMIENSELNTREQDRSIRIFKVIAEAEGKIHGISVENVHFHEVGAMDSIIDIVGTCVALENLNIDEIYSTPVATGFGYINIAHGLYPVPAPATLEILKNIPLADFAVEGELTTPTGAGFLKGIVDGFSDVISGEIIKIGYGKGTKQFDHPNVLRTALVKKKVKMNL